MGDMPTIHFFDTNTTDANKIRSLASSSLPKESPTFHAGPATALPDAVVVSPFVTSQITADMMAAMPNLKLIACRSTGYDHIDLKAAAQHGVTVCNVPSYGENTVAEYAFGLLLALTRKIPAAIHELKAGNTSLDALQGNDLMGKTLGILGAGRIGCHMAAMGRGFGMKVIAFDAYPNPERAQTYGFTYVSQEEVLATSDVISVHVPNLPETHHLFNASVFAKMKSSALLVNTARAEVVDTPALIDALAEHRLAGAALDVFEKGHEATLQAFPNVILTNHNAFNTVEAVDRINQTTLANIAAFLAGTPQNQVKA